MGRMILRNASERNPAIDAQTTSPIVPVACSAATFGKYSGWSGSVSCLTTIFDWALLNSGMNFLSCQVASSLARMWILTSTAGPPAAAGLAASGAAAGLVAAAGALVAAAVVGTAAA